MRHFGHGIGHLQYERHQEVKPEVAANGDGTEPVENEGDQGCDIMDVDVGDDEEAVEENEEDSESEVSDDCNSDEIESDSESESDNESLASL